MPPLTDNGKQSLAVVSQGEAMLAGAGIRLSPLRLAEHTLALTCLHTQMRKHALAHSPIYTLTHRSVSRHTFTHTHAHTHTGLNRHTAQRHPIQAGRQGPWVLPQPGTQTHRHPPCPERDRPSRASEQKDSQTPLPSHPLPVSKVQHQETDTTQRAGAGRLCLP